MNILYCGDSNIADGVIMSVLSLLKNTKEQLSISILTMYLKTEEKTFHPFPRELAYFLDKKVKEANPQNSLELIDVTKEFRSFSPKANLQTRFTPFCMLRLYADLVPELPDKILYLDNDVICESDFKDFYDRDMTGIEAIGVLDRYGKWFFRRKLFRFDYLNSGVLLLNLSEIKKTGLFEKCRRMCRDNKMLLPDQSSFNKLSRTKKICKGKYNEQRRSRPGTVFRHYSTTFQIFPRIKPVTVKPWQIDRVHEILKSKELDELYREYKVLYSEFTSSLARSEEAI